MSPQLHVFHLGSIDKATGLRFIIQHVKSEIAYAELESGRKNWGSLRSRKYTAIAIDANAAPLLNDTLVVASASPGARTTDASSLPQYASQ